MRFEFLIASTSPLPDELDALLMALKKSRAELSGHGQT